MIRIAIKDLKIFVRDIKALLLSFLLPIALISLFGITFGGLQKRESKQEALQILLADLDSSATSQDVIAKLDSTDEIAVKPISLEAGKLEIMDGNSLAMLVLYAGFADSVQAGKPEPLTLFVDEAREMEARLVQYALISHLMEIVGSKTLEKKIVNSMHSRYPDIDPEIMASIEEEIGLQFAGSDESGQSISDQIGSITVTPLSRRNSVNWALIQAFAGTAVMMLLFSVAAMGSSILSEREEGTLKRLLYSPIRPVDILFGKMIMTIVIGVVQLIIMLVFSVLVLGLDMEGNLLYLFILIVATAFACSAFGLFIAAVSTSRKQSEGLSTIVILIMSAIGGSMIPLIFMPAFMQKMAVISVNYWAIQGFFDILGRDASLLAVLPKIGVLILIGTALTFLSVFFYQRNIRKVA